MRARDGLVPARIIEEQRERQLALHEHGTCWSRPSGRFRHAALDHQDRSAVGDWVLLEPAPQEGEGVIHGVLPRASSIVRRAARRSVDAQVVAANVDTAFLVMSLNRDFNPRRLERYLAMIAETGVSPVVLLNKIDLCEDLDAAMEAVRGVVRDTTVHALCALDGRGFDVLAPYLGTGTTVAVIGSSGVGKSTLINRLAGKDVQLVRAIREADDRGRHTTTSRHLIELPGGGVLVDTPGMRELGLFEASTGMQVAFQEVEALISACRFRDCRHEAEPGCAVRAALEAGELEAQRYAAYCKLQRELAFVASKQNQKVAVERRHANRRLTKSWRKQARQDPRIREKRGRG